MALKRFFSGVIRALQGRPYLNVALIGATGLFSRGLGLVRDRLLAGTYSTGTVVDAYVAAFKVPDFIFAVCMLGAFAAACIPLFVRVRAHGLYTVVQGEKYVVPDREGISIFTSHILTIFGLIATVVAAALAIFAPTIVPYIVPGFSEESIAMTITMMRIVAWTVPIFTVSNILSGLLSSEERFWSLSWSPVMYNLGIICGILLSAHTGIVWWLPIGAVVGSGMHAAILLPELKAIRWKYRFTYMLSDIRRYAYQWTDRMTELIKLMVPRFFSVSVQQAQILILTVLLSLHGTGKVSAFYYAHNVQSVPLGLIGISFSFVVFPILARAYQEKKFDVFSEHVHRNIQLMFFFLIPIVALFLVLRTHTVRLILGTGAFDWEATVFTAQTLGILAIALVPQSLTPLFTKSFFARGDTKTPFYVAAITTTVSVVGMYFGHKWFGYFGIVGGFATATWVELIAYYILLKKHIPNVCASVGAAFKNAFAAGAVTAFATYFALHGIDSFIVNETFWGLFLQTGFAGLSGVIAWLAYQLFARPTGWTLLEQYAKKYIRLKLAC